MYCVIGVIGRSSVLRFLQMWVGYSTGVDEPVLYLNFKIRMNIVRFVI